MPASLSPETTTAIVLLFLQGFTRDAIADELHIGQGTVSNELHNLKNAIDEPTFNILKELGKCLQQNDVNFDDAIIGFHIKSLLKKLGIGVETIKDFVEGFYTACVQNGVEPTIAIKTVKRVIEIEKDTQIVFEELPQKYKDILDKIKTAEETLATLKVEIVNTKNEKTVKIKELEEKIKLLTQQHDDVYLKYNTSEKKVIFFTEIFEFLKKKKIPIEDTEKFAKMLADAKNLGYGEKIIISQIQASKTYREDLKQAQYELHQLQEQTKSANSELNALQKQKIQVWGEVESLKNQQIVLKKNVEDRKEEIILLTELFKKQLEEMLRSYFKNMDQAKSKASTEFQYLVSDTRESWEKFLEQEKLEAQNARIRLDESYQKLNEKCVEFGKIKNHTILVKLIDGTADTPEILLAMMFVFQRFSVFVGKSQFKSKGLLLQIISTLIKKIQEEFDEFSKDN